jgi:hypothetical protein
MWASGRRLLEVGRRLLGDPLPRNMKSHRALCHKQEVAGGFYTYAWRDREAHTHVYKVYSAHPLLPPARAIFIRLADAIATGYGRRRYGCSVLKPPAHPLPTSCWLTPPTWTTSAVRMGRCCAFTAR